MTETKKPRPKHSELINDVHEFDIIIPQRTVFLYSQQFDESGDEAGVEIKMVMKFIKNIEYLNSISQEPIKIILISPGGECYCGLAIYDCMKASKAPIDVYCYGEICSMATVMVQAARKRYISKNCAFMIHYASYFIAGESKRSKSTMDFYETFNPRMFAIYASRCKDSVMFNGKDEESIIDCLNQMVDKKRDLWLNAEEAISYGFADEVF